MATLKRYVLANREHRIPMPDRGGRHFDASDAGETVDIEMQFYATLVADRDIVPARSKRRPAATEKGPAE